MASKPVRVKFSEVGRDKRNWEADIPHDGELSCSAMVRSIKQHGAIVSHGIDFEDGDIFVGGFRCVGHYEIVESKGTT